MGGWDFFSQQKKVEHLGLVWGVSTFGFNSDPGFSLLLQMIKLLCVAGGRDGLTREYMYKREEEAAANIVYQQ